MLSVEIFLCVPQLILTAMAQWFRCLLSDYVGQEFPINPGSISYFWNSLFLRWDAWCMVPFITTYLSRRNNAIGNMPFSICSERFVNTGIAAWCGITKSFIIMLERILFSVSNRVNKKVVKVGIDLQNKRRSQMFCKWRSCFI